MLLLQSRQSNIDPSPELLDKVMAAIQCRQELILLKRKLAFAFCLLVLSISSYVPAVGSFSAQAKSAGMFGFLSILFFDLKSLGYYWKELAWSLLESFPATETAGLLVLTLLVVGAIIAMVRYIKIIRGLSQLIHN